MTLPRSPIAPGRVRVRPRPAILERTTKDNREVITDAHARYFEIREPQWVYASSSPALLTIDGTIASIGDGPRLGDPALQLLRRVGSAPLQL